MKKSNNDKINKKTEIKGMSGVNKDGCCTWLFDVFKKDDEVKEGGHE